MTGAVTIGRVRISHPDKAWWPDDGITKGDVARFYDEHFDLVRSYIDKHLLTAERCPNGMADRCFFQKNFATGLPPRVPTKEVLAESTGKMVSYVVGGSRAALLSLVNLGSIAIHTMNCRATALDRPVWMAFDMDPMTGTFEDAAKAGLVFKEILDERRLPSFPKTSGSRGLHIFIPLSGRPTQAAVRAYAQEIGREAARRAPGLITAEMSKSARGAKVFADSLRNAFGQTIVAPYSVRHRAKATVSTPLAWDEVDPRLDPAAFTIRTLGPRLRGSDPWAGFWGAAVPLPAAQD